MIGAKMYKLVLPNVPCCMAAVTAMADDFLLPMLLGEDVARVGKDKAWENPRVQATFSTWIEEERKRTALTRREREGLWPGAWGTLLPVG